MGRLLSKHSKSAEPSKPRAKTRWLRRERVSRLTELECASTSDQASPSSFPKLPDNLTVEEELFQAADERIRNLNKGGVVQGRAEIAEPQSDHAPYLINMEEYEDYIAKAKSYAIDRRFIRQGEQFIGQQIDLADIMRDVTTKDSLTKACKHAMLIGAAGMGKTTLLRRIARYAREGKIEALKDKLIIIPDFRTFATQETILPSEALLENMFFDGNSQRMESRYQWIKENSDKIVFLIDSLDTLPFDFQTECNRIGYDQASTPEEILHNLMAGDLFSKSLIISSSREYKVRNLHPSVRPDRCILLDGLSKESIEDLLDGFLGKDKADEVKKHIDTQCPDVWPLLSIPVFLVFSVIGFVRDGFRPKTMSGILIKTFIGLINSPHVHVKNILGVLNKLMPLSFEGIRQGRVLFTPGNLRKFDIEPEEAADLGILIPESYGTYFTSKLMQNDRFFLYFNHQTQQECLAALFVLSMATGEFEVFIMQEIYDPTFSVVRRLVCGTLLNSEVLEEAMKLTKISDVDQKRRILLRSLKATLQRVDKEQLLEILIDLNESKDGVLELIRLTVRKIDLSGISLNLSDLQAVAFVMKQCNHLDCVDFKHCNLYEEKVEFLAKPLIQSNLKITKLDIGGNVYIGRGGMFHLGIIVNNYMVDELDAWNCRLTPEHFEKFADGTGNAKLRILNLSKNEDIGIGGMYHLGRILKNCPLEELYVCECELEEDHLKKLADCAEKTTITLLNVRGNWRLGPEGMFQLGRIVNNWKLEVLCASGCSIKVEHLRRFAEGAGTAKLRKLNVGENTELRPDGVYLLGEMVRDREIKNLCAGNCNFNDDEIEKLAEGLGDAVLTDLDLSDSLHRPAFNFSLLNLLPRVEHELNLQYWNVDKSEQEELVNELNEIGSSTLTIVLGDKENPTYLKASIQDTISVVPERTERRSVDEAKGTSSIPDGESAPESDDKTSIVTIDDISAEMDRRIKTKSIKRKIVGAKGGSIENFGCKLTFPPRAFDKDTEVQTSVITDFSDCPEDKIPIAPIIECNPPGRLNRPALLEVEHWAVPTGDNVFAEIYRKDCEDSEWQIVERVLIKGNQKITFYTDHFTLYEFLMGCASSIWAGITRPFVQVALQNLVYISNAHHSIACVCCLKDDKVMHAVTQTLEKSTYVPLLPLPETMHARRGGQVTSRLVCIEPPNLEVTAKRNQEIARYARNIAPEFPVNVILAKSQRTKYISARMRDGDLKKYDGMLIVDYELTADDDTVEHRLQTVWPIPGAAPTRKTEVNILGNIRTESILAPDQPQNQPVVGVSG